MQIPIEFFNNSGEVQPATITANGVVSCLTNNLKSKKAYISSLNFSDESIPKFIPEYIKGDVETYRNEIFNYLMALPNSLVSNLSSANDVPTVNMTPYYVIVSYQAPAYGGAELYFVQYVQHEPNSNVKSVPSSYPSTLQNYYENDYYYYSNFGTFLQSIETTFNNLMILANSMASGTNETNLFNLTYNDQTITMNYNVDFVNTPGIKLYFSNTLIDLIGVKTGPRQPLFTQIDLRSGEVTGDFLTIEQPVSINKICTVKNIVVTTNMPCEQVQIFSNLSTPNFIESHPIILFLNFVPNSVFQTSESANYNATVPIPYIYFTDDQYMQINKNLQFSIYIRLNNGIMLLLKCQRNDYINLVLRVEKNLIQ